ncbi:MAG: SWIM zinc finger family protein [Cyanobacteria bacterium P01_G01_bin.19]
MGNNARPYQVTINIRQDEFIEADCTCPYDWGGYCKHRVAALLTCLHEPDKIKSRPSLEQILDRLNEIQTQNLIQKLVADKPELLNDIERFADRIVPPVVVETEANKSRRKITVNPNAIRSKVRYILEDSVRHFEYGGEEDIASEEIYSLIQDAQMYTQQGDYGNAIAMLTAITESCVENWDVVDEYGVDNGEVASQLSDVWCETILSADLEQTEKVDLQVHLEFWRNCWGEYFDLVAAALEQGWDYPPLQQVLQGNITSLGAWDGEAPYYADDLALIRLQILARQERFEEYLYLAEAEGQIVLYLNMLVRLERVTEAMQAAASSMSTNEEALAFSQCLVNEQNAQVEALAIAKQGLELPGRSQYELAKWASEIALELDDVETATQAKIKAFQASPNFADYLQIEKLAAEDWLKIKPELLATLADYHSWGAEDAKVNIYLHEGMVDKAIAIVDNFSYYGNRSVKKVMDAAVNTHPDWVISNACKKAEAIVNEGKAKYYEEAVEWLEKARSAFLAADRKREWSDYRTNLVTVHERKRKFMGLMKSLT